MDRLARPTGADASSIKLRVISLGAGVQSTTLALMAAHGEIEPMPDCAIFADTGWEPRAVYEHLDWLEQRLPFAVHRVSNGNIRADILANAAGEKKSGRAATPPYFTGNGGFLRRQCTEHYKLIPIKRKLRELLGVEKGRRVPTGAKVEVWIGISTDEASRMKPSPDGWADHVWPLIDKRMSRWDCLRWMGRNGYPQPPKSACIGCPFHDNAAWRSLRDGSPAEWADAIAVDRAIRNGFRGTTEALFTHRSCVPLPAVDLSTAEDRGQMSLFNNECEGMCGV